MMALRRIHGLAAFGVAAGLALGASTARADQAADMKEMVRQEVEAYLKAEKEKKSKEDAEKGTMKVSWKDGLRFESADKKFKAKIFGRLQVDYWGFDPDEELEAAVGEFDSGVFFRRARLGVEFDICKYGWVKFEYDFARGGNNQNGFTDAFIGLKGMDECVCGLPDIRVGHFFEPFGLETPTSSRCNTFIERASLDNLGVGRNTGIAVMNSYWDRLTYEVGFFQANSNNWGDGIFNEDPPVDDFTGDNDGWAVTARVSGLPWVDCNCPDRRFVHLGASYSHRDDLNTVQYRARPEVGIGPRVVDTTAFAAESIDMFGAEAALLLGPLHVQAEYVNVMVTSPAAGDPTFFGWFVEAGYFLTGESRGYNKHTGRWDCVKVCRPLLCENCCGAGAWQVAARYSVLDLDDGNFDGGVMNDITVGLNWYLYNNIRVMFNYVYSDVENAQGTGRDGTVNSFGVRVAAYW